MNRWVRCPPIIGLGLKRTGSKYYERWGARSATPNDQGKLFLLGVWLSRYSHGSGCLGVRRLETSIQWGWFTDPAQRFEDCTFHTLEERHTHADTTQVVQVWGSKCQKHWSKRYLNNPPGSLLIELVPMRSFFKAQQINVRSQCELPQAICVEIELVLFHVLEVLERKACIYGRGSVPLLCIRPSLFAQTAAQQAELHW